MSHLLSKHFYDSANRYSSKAALKEKIKGQYHAITYQEMKERVEQMAGFLIHAGFASGSKMAILSENRPEWPIADMAMILAGCVNVPIYPTLPPAQISYILQDSDTEVIVVSKANQLKKIHEIYKECPKLKLIVCLETASQELVFGGIQVIEFKAVLSQGEQALKQLRSTLEQRIESAQENDLVSIVYTSGTTGHPKGVMLSHLNFASNAKAAAEALGFDYSQTTLSFLPLSHVLERVVNYTIQYCGATIAYAESIDTISQNLQEVHPSAFVAVPRVFEKIYNRIISTIENDKPLKRHIFYWALDIGKQVAHYTTRGQVVPAMLAAKHKVADALVFKKIKDRTGGNLKFAISGGAPLMRELAEFFFAVGIEVYEGYGLTETSPVICVNRPKAVRFGAVGQVIEDVEIQIAPDGEILAKGPNIMQGYYKNPTATAEVLEADGWFHTGDIGEIDSDGFLRITDRKKEIIVMSNGKNVAPQPIENALKNSSLIEQAVMIGNNQKYMAALIYPSFDAIEKWAQSQKVTFSNHLEIIQHAEVKKLLRAEIDKYTQDFARYEQVKKFALIEDELTQENDCLTPTLKYKRRIINLKYTELIDELFDETIT